MSLDLSSSLTAMDWLPQLRVDHQHHQHHHYTQQQQQHQHQQPHFTAGGGYHRYDPRLPPHRPIGRKPPPSPIDLSARLNPIEAEAYRYQDAKPPYSYATLITYAINSSSKRLMTLNEIYNWICTNFPFYRDAGTGWKVCQKDIYNTDLIHIINFTVSYINA